MAALLVTIAVACGGTPGSSEPSSASTTLSTDDGDGGGVGATEDAGLGLGWPVPSPIPEGSDAAPPPEPTGAACQTDADCSGADLCVEHVCREGCRSHDDCASGFCNFDNDGHCFNEHGCNPPPDGEMCPMICWGYCDTPHDGG